ncbi:TonB-dependent siderophore receptor [Bosea sp. (in: a-proteobacteria)]|uniref:TonB-dependent siderophore receptor n=1 Tax=Bosea sp. (in: a-proteobacteria) TaxID=1871050 RepID=UPI002732EFEF|nr:TonB-dependent siderophore receptor [Bosea sp. (in: a-proteobacteria)]MDP3410378.1 TonB-dependent siderophore receptor [Bosea sp. (in: a-proteobacteria)]
MTFKSTAGASCAVAFSCLSPLAAPAFAQQPNAVQLDTITVEGPRDGARITDTTAGPVQGIRALTAGSATRTDTPIEQLPQSIQVLPRQLIEQQATTTISEALTNVSNAQPANPLGIANTDIAPLRIRGFPAEQWRDGLVTLYNAGDRDGLANVERIEVLKGPSTILYGGGVGSPLGGVLNVVSKLPRNENFVQSGLRFGSYGYWNPWFDINRKLTADGSALFRMTGEFTGNRSFIDTLDSKRYNINPTLTLTNNDSTTLTIQGFLSRQQQQAYQGLPVYGTILGDFRLRPETFVGPRTLPDSYTRNHGIATTLDHKFNDIWSAKLKARWSQTQFDQLSQNIFGGDATGAVPAFGPSTWFLQNLQLFQKQEEFTINPTVKAKFDLGPTKNVVLAGLDYTKVRDKGFMTGDYLGNLCYMATFDPVLCPPTTVDLQSPAYTTPFTRPTRGVGEYAAFFDYRNDYVTKGAFAQIQSTVFERVHLLAGARLASIDIKYDEYALTPAARITTEKTKLLPRAGVVLDVWQGLSAFASYTEGMRWVGFSTAVTRPAPETSRQAEAGLKFKLGDALSGTLAYFNIHRDNVPVSIALGVAALSQQKSQGFEADVIWQPNTNWSFLASYGFTDATFASPLLDYNGGSVPTGSKLPFVPERSGRLWANYKFDTGTLAGLSLGAGVYAASSQYVDPANKWKTSAYFTVDAKIAYERDNWKASLAVKNLTGERYYTPYAWLGGQVAPGAPRTVYAELSYIFK